MSTTSTHSFPVRGDWSHKIMGFLFKNLHYGYSPLNEFAQVSLAIDPDDENAGGELDQVLQGLEDRHQIFYRVKAKTDLGTNSPTLNKVQFEAILQQDGLRLMIDQSQSTKLLNLTFASIFVATAALVASIASAIIQFNDSTDKELLKLNKQLQTPLQSIESSLRPQTKPVVSQSPIKDSLTN